MPWRRGRGRSRCFGWRGRVAFQLRREPIPAPGNGGDDFRSQHFAQRRDLHLHVVLLDDQTRPYEIQQLVLGDQAASAFHQRDEHIEGAWRQSRGLASGEQPSLRRLQREAAELVFR